MQFKKYISKELLIAIILDIMLLFFASVTTADLNDPRDTRIVFAIAFVLMAIITILTYRYHNSAKKL